MTYPVIVISRTSVGTISNHCHFDTPLRAVSTSLGGGHTAQSRFAKSTLLDRLSPKNKKPVFRTGFASSSPTTAVHWNSQRPWLSLDLCFLCVDGLCGIEVRRILSVARRADSNHLFCILNDGLPICKRIPDSPGASPGALRPFDSLLDPRLEMSLKRRLIPVLPDRLSALLFVDGCCR